MCSFHSATYQLNLIYQMWIFPGVLFSSSKLFYVTAYRPKILQVMSSNWWAPEDVDPWRAVRKLQ